MTGLFAWGEMTCNETINGNLGGLMKNTHLPWHPSNLAQLGASFFALRHADENMSISNIK